MKILTIIGARPQFIKAGVVSRAIELHNNNNKHQKIKEVIVHTGQHFDINMSEIFIKEMQMPQPDFNLCICDTLHGKMIGRMIERIEEIIIKVKPDIVLVYGDTNSTLAGALAAVKYYIPIAHVEAGLRSYNMRMPEEVNRILTDRISRWLFCPSDQAMKNLKAEGIVYDNASHSTCKNAMIYNVGDVMYDASLYFRKVARPSNTVVPLIKTFKYFYLATVHRAENTDDENRLREIIGALDEISKKIPVVLPLHPRTKKFIRLYNITYSYLKIINPVGYFDMIALLDNCKAVFTDSGGLQKEAYFFHKPCITLRDETEWVELVKEGFNTLTGADREKILEAEYSFVNCGFNFSKKLYGDGNAGFNIIKILIG